MEGCCLGGMGGVSVAEAPLEPRESNISTFRLYAVVYTKNPLQNMIICVWNEKQGKEGQEQLLDNMKVDFGVRMDLG